MLILKLKKSYFFQQGGSRLNFAFVANLFNNAKHIRQIPMSARGASVSALNAALGKNNPRKRGEGR